MAKLRNGMLLGCGNPLLDISGIVEPEYLMLHELLADNAILAEEKHKPIFEDLVEKYKASYIAGGSVQNSLRVAQWILGIPNLTVFFGCVGKDKFADILESRARSEGVNVRYQRKSDVSTGKCAVLITGKHRSLIADLAAANCFSEDHILEAENLKYVDSADFYYISGFFLTVSPSTIISVAKKAMARNRPFMMNLSAPFISEFFKDQLMSVMPYIDILFGNETEALAFAGAQGFNTTCIKDIGLKIAKLEKFNNNRKRIVVITQGCDPVLLIENDTVREFPIVQLKESEIVDTNGAGDAFVGGFLSQLIQEKPYDICIKCGSYTAREIIKRSGCSVDGKPNFIE